MYTRLTSKNTPILPILALLVNRTRLKINFTVSLKTFQSGWFHESAWIHYISSPGNRANIPLSSAGSSNLLASHAGVIRAVVLLPFPSSSSPVSPLAWDQAPHWGIKEKVIGVGEKNRRVRFACRYFSYLAPFFCFCILRIAPLRSLVPGYTLPLVFFFFFAFKMTAAIIYSGTPLQRSARVLKKLFVIAG